MVIMYTRTPLLTLPGGIADDATWQDKWTRLVALPTSKYECPGGVVSNDFVTMMIGLWEGVIDDKHNSEMPMIFVAVILQKCSTVKKAKDKRRQVSQSLEIWAPRPLYGARPGHQTAGVEPRLAGKP